MTIHSGDVFWVHPSDAAGVAPNHPHPYVVVSPDVFNQSRLSTVVVCALTSNLGRASEPGCVLLDDGEANLPKRSVVLVSQIDSIDKASLGPRIGTLSPARVQQILSGLQFLQTSYFNQRE